MKKKIEEINFDNIDYTKYEADLKIAAKLAHDIKKDRKLMRMLKNYRQEREIQALNIIYNKLSSNIDTKEESNFKEIKKYAIKEKIGLKRNNNITESVYPINISSFC